MRPAHDSALCAHGPLALAFAGRLQLVIGHRPSSGSAVRAVDLVGQADPRPRAEMGRPNQAGRRVQKRWQRTPSRRTPAGAAAAASRLPAPKAAVKHVDLFNATSHTSVVHYLPTSKQRSLNRRAFSPSRRPAAPAPGTRQPARALCHGECGYGSAGWGVVRPIIPRVDLPRSMPLAL